MADNITLSVLMQDVYNTSDKRAGEEIASFFYKVSLHVTKDELRRLNGKPLVPSMPVEIFIKTKDRSILSYPVMPFLDQVSRMFKD